MDWFLYDRELSHERFNDPAKHYSKSKIETVDENGKYTQI